MTSRVLLRLPVEVHAVDETDDLIVQDEARATMVVLNPVGAAAFGLIDGVRDESAIVDVIASVYTEVAHDVLANDVRCFFDELLQRGLVSERTPA
jgi:Coenzyme PQQ synthesis protein D (PqqD)